MFEELILNIVRANPGSKTVDIRKKFLALHPDHDWKEKSFRDMGTNGLIVDVRSVQIYTAWYIPTDVDLTLQLAQIQYLSKIQIRLK